VVLLSLIIPVYNVESYILECLKSVIKAFPDNGSVEVIIVDDGSPDNSMHIVFDYINSLGISLKSNFNIVRQENKGLSAARNTGINISKGLYLAFLDSDDILQGNFFNDILAIIKNHNPDIIEFRAFRFEDNGNTSNFLPKLFDNGFYNLDKNIWKKLCNRSAWFSWLRVYNKKLFDDIKFPEGTNYEDAYTTPYIYLISKNIYFLNQEYLGYRFNPSGITATKSIKNIDDIGGAAEKMIDFFYIRPELSSSFIALSHYYISNSYEVEGFLVAKKRWKLLKDKIYGSNFDKSFISNTGNKLFYIFGVNFVCAFYFLKKIGIKK
jgi:glycosyltransferase involved in cell wall biosynthesis